MSHIIHNKNLVALLKWRGLKFNEESIKNIKQNDITCTFNSFVDFTILRKNINLDKFRKQYEKITGESWKEATIQKIYKAPIVWSF